MVTGTKYDEEGYDKKGYDEEGYNREGYNKVGFNREGFHKITGTKYDEEGYDEEGYNKNGYNIHGYDKRGFNIRGFNHLTFTYLDKEGYDKDGYNEEGYNREGFNKDGYDRHNFNKTGIHKITNTEYNEYGFNSLGINRFTNTLYDSDGYNIDGRNEQGLTKEKNDERSQRFAVLKDLIYKVANNEMSMEKFRAVSKLTIEELFDIAVKSNLPSEIKLGIKKRFKEYHKYDDKMSLETMEQAVSFFVNGEVISLKGKLDEMKKVKDYMVENGLYICTYSLKKYIKMYLVGELDLTKPLNENIQEEQKLEEKKEVANPKTESSKVDTKDALKQFREMFKQREKNKISDEEKEKTL